MRAIGQAWLKYLCLIVVVMAGLSRADVVVVAPDQQPATILVPDQEGQSKRMATTLAGYLKKITGKEFPIAYGSTTADRVIEVVKVNPDAEPKLGKEAFVIEAKGNRIQLIGGSDQSRLYAVFEFLHQYGGARWWSHNEEDLPALEKITVPEGRQIIRPAFDQYLLMNAEARFSWGPDSPNNFNAFRFKLRSQSLLNYTGNHNLNPLLASYGATHPEIYPMDKQGKRAPNNLHFCYLADGIADALVEAISREVEKRHGNVADWVYFAGMGDASGGMCQCDRCKPVYEEEAWTDPDGFKKPGYIATLLRMLNKTAGVLKQKYPGIQVGTFAYLSLEAPPAKTRPADNVIILLPRLRHVTVRSILEADELVIPRGTVQAVQTTQNQDTPTPANVRASNRSFRHNLEQWAQIAPGQVRIWEYAANYNNFFLPFPCLRSMAENLKYYHQKGISGLLFQGSYQGTGGDMIVLKNYVLGRLLWDPQADTQNLIKEFCDGYYGPASAEAYAYVNALEDTVRKPVPMSLDEFADMRKQLCTPELVDRLEAILKPGIERCASADPKYLLRIKELWVSLEAARIWLPGPLIEQNGYLVRSDLGGDTSGRALELLKYIRNGTPREWGKGPRYQQNFISWHGGPVHTLTQGPLKVQVAAMQTGRAGPIHYQGTEVIRETFDGPEGTPYRVVGVVQSQRALLESDFGLTNAMEIAPWINRRTIQIDSPDTLSFLGTLRKVQGGTDGKSCTPEIITSYPVQSFQEMAMESAGPDGVFKPINLDPGGRKRIEIKNLQKLRVTLLASKRRVTDQYLSGEKVATATVEQLGKDKGDCVRLTVTLPPVEVDRQQMRTYEERTLLFE